MASTPGGATPAASAARRALLSITLLGLLVRALFLLLEPATQPVADERTWVDWARIVTDRSFSPLRTHMIFHPPLYPYFLAVPYALTGSLALAKWLQVLVTSLAVPAVGRVGIRLFGVEAGLVAAALAAFYPELVWFSAHFWVENVFLVLTWWGFERLLAADDDDERRVSLAVAAGALWGLAVLARETLLYFIPVAALWLATRSPRGRARALAFAATAVLLVAPWTYRNWRAFHAFVPVSTAGGLNLFQGNAPLTRQEVYDRYDAVQGRIEQYRYALGSGLQAIRERQPAWIFEKLRDEMPAFWEAESMAVIHVKRGAYGPVRPGVAVAVALVMLVPYLVVLVFFVAGLAALRLDRRRGLMLALLVYYMLLHVVTHGFNRYRLPVMPAVFVVAGFAASAWWSGRYPPLSGARKVLAAALGLVLGLSLLPSLWTQWHHPAFRQVGPGMPPGPAGVSEPSR